MKTAVGKLKKMHLEQTLHKIRAAVSKKIRFLPFLKGVSFQLTVITRCDPPWGLGREKGVSFQLIANVSVNLTGAAGSGRFWPAQPGSAGAKRSHEAGSRPPPNAAGAPKVGSRASPNSLK